MWPSHAPPHALRCRQQFPVVPSWFPPILYQLELLNCNPRTPRPALFFPPRGSFSGGDTMTHSLLPHQQ